MTEPVFGLSFAGGINQSDQAELVDASSSFALLQNTRQRHRGAVSKRDAYVFLGADRLDGSTRTAGHRVLANDDQLCTIDGERIDVYVNALARFVPRSPLPEADFTSFAVPAVGLYQDLQPYVSDVVHVNGYIVIVEVVPGPSSARGVYASVIEAATKAVVVGPTNILNASNSLELGLATFGTTVVLGSCNPGISRVILFSLDTASAATLSAGWSTLVSITATGTSGSLAMATLPAAPDRVAIAYDVGSGTDRLVIKTVGAAGVIETVTVNTSSTAPEAFDISDGSEILWVAWALGGTAYVQGLNPSDIDGAVVATADPSGVISYTSDSATIFVSTAGVGVCMVVGSFDSAPLIVMRVKNDSGAAVSDAPSASTFWNARPKSRPFCRGSKVYQWVGSDKTDDLVLCDITLPSGGSDYSPLYLRPVVAPIARGLVAPFFFQRCRTASIDGNAFAFAFPVKRTGLSDGIYALEIDFASLDRWGAASFHQGTYLGGGVTYLFDGSHAFEAAFLCAPPLPGIDTGSAGSMTFTNGGRRYVAVYASPDADGNLAISGVSNPTDATGNITSKTISITVAPLAITARSATSVTEAGPKVWAFLYATADGGEEPYHLIKSLANDPSTAFLNFEDDVDETALASGALLYGSGNLPGTVQDGQPGGPQDHRAPPGLRHLTTYNGMLIGAANDEVWYSSQAIYGEAPWWSPVFSVQFDERITSLFVMDGTLYATTKSSVYALSGDPPNDAGTSGGLGIPRKLAVERGCINARSVCVTSGGTFYQSDRGYELFRQGGITPVGDLVQDTLADFPHVTSAVFHAARGLVIISLAQQLDDDGLADDFHAGSEGGPDTGGGRDLIFDAVLGVWASVDRKRGVSGQDQASQHAAMVNLDGAPAYVWIDPAGVVYSDDNSTHLDQGNAWIAMVAETGWIRTAGMQGEQFIDRILFLAKRVTSHDITISIGYDYADTYATVRQFPASKIDALVRPWLDAEVGQSTNQALRVRIEDATPTSGSVGTGAGSEWIDVTINGQPHKGAKRTSGAQRSG